MVRKSTFMYLHKSEQARSLNVSWFSHSLALPQMQSGDHTYRGLAYTSMKYICILTSLLTVYFNNTIYTIYSKNDIFLTDIQIIWKYQNEFHYMKQYMDFSCLVDIQHLVEVV